MPEDPGFLVTALLIIVVVMIFNLIIFVHELGHFWAAKWRGLKIDRFQIWFGKPLWKKQINGVQYGLGWLPAGGFVALPQMAPMEAIEGGNRDGEALPPISPLDKIIVAFAGPFFSFLLAFACACIITLVGKPQETLPTTTIGAVEPGSKAEEAGLMRGDRILAIDGQPVTAWHGGIDSVFTHIATSRQDNITFTVDRPEVGELNLSSGFEIPETKWWQRRALRQVGIRAYGPLRYFPIDAENAPAAVAGLEPGDHILSFNGTPIYDNHGAIDYLKENGPKPVEIAYERTAEDGTTTSGSVVVTPSKPIEATDENKDRYMVGGIFALDPEIKEEWVKPGPMAQVTDTVRQMWLTIRSVSSPKSSIGVQHLSGPVGIFKIQLYQLLMDHPVNRILGFMVLININLAILNMLPFPVLDGGHITIAIMEAIARKPVNVKFLEVLQLAFVFMLFSLMIYVTSKDIPDDFGMGSGETEAPPKLRFAAPDP